MMPLYILEPYRKEADAQVIGCLPDNLIEIDNNLFYPNSGGQPGDTGTLSWDAGTAKVLDTIKKDGKILLKTDVQVPPDAKVHCILNWETRYKHMRMHTAAHLLSAIINKEAGALITGNQLGIERSRIDFNLEQFDKDMFQHYANMANEMIRKKIGIGSMVITRNDLEKNPQFLKLAKGLPESVQEVRIVSIEGYDSQPCGGTHLENTGEIGSIRILDMENKGKNNRRLYFTIGDLN